MGDHEGLGVEVRVGDVVLVVDVADVVLVVDVVVVVVADDGGVDLLVIVHLHVIIVLSVNRQSETKFNCRNKKIFLYRQSFL